MKIRNSDVKNLAKGAKKRLQTGFWEQHCDEISLQREAMFRSGFSEKEVLAMYDGNNQKNDKKRNNKEIFYERVKKLLDEKGEVGNIISLLIDKKFFDGLSYDAKQKYLLEFSEEYRSALGRYTKEKLLKSKN